MSKIHNKVCIVTGGGNGIGRALCETLASSGARGIYVVDINLPSANTVATTLSSLATHPNFKSGYDVANVGTEGDIQRVISSAWELFGRVDIFFSNAGIFGTMGGVNQEEVSNELWEEMWHVNVMSHIYAARHLFPLWKQYKMKGIFVITASAAGLLMQIGVLPYHVTKHAAVAVADWLAVEHYEGGVSVHCVCPQLVRTNMMTLSMSQLNNSGKKKESSDDGGGHVYSSRDGTTKSSSDGPAGLDGIAEPKEVALSTINGIEDGRFLVLPHPQVKKYIAGKGSDYDRWIKGMRKFKSHFGDMVKASAPKSKL